MRCAVSESPGTRGSGDRPNWADLLRGEGIEFVVVADRGASPRRRSNLPEVDAVLLTGGPVTSAPGSGIQDGRDTGFRRTDRELVRYARYRGLPVLGIGRGAEFLGLYYGGRLIPRGEGHRTGEPSGVRLEARCGGGQAMVLCDGDLALDRQSLPDGIDPFAWDEENRIMGFAHRREPVLGIHWQPLDPTDDSTLLVLSSVRDGTPLSMAPRTDPPGSRRSRTKVER